LQPYLKGLAEGKTPQEKLFGDHWRDWVRKWVKRMTTQGPFIITDLSSRSMMKGCSAPTLTCGSAGTTMSVAARSARSVR
jgi:hypothetical protein